MTTRTPASFRTLIKSEFDLGKIRYLARNYEVNGKLNKYVPAGVVGIQSSSHSPIDVTQIANDAAKAFFQSVIRFVKEIPEATVEYESSDLVTVRVKTGKKDGSTFMVYISLARFQSYQASEGLDPGYQTSWVIFRFE